MHKAGFLPRIEKGGVKPPSERERQKCGSKPWKQKNRAPPRHAGKDHVHGESEIKSDKNTAPLMSSNHSCLSDTFFRQPVPFPQPMNQRRGIRSPPLPIALCTVPSLTPLKTQRFDQPKSPHDGGADAA